MDRFEAWHFARVFGRRVPAGVALHSCQVAAGDKALSLGMGNATVSLDTDNKSRGKRKTQYGIGRARVTEQESVLVALSRVVSTGNL